jgi:hypothetical protein
MSLCRSAYNDPVLVKKGLATGAFVYVSKLRAGEDLVPAIHAAPAGEQSSLANRC